MSRLSPEAWRFLFGATITILPIGFFIGGIIQHDARSKAQFEEAYKEKIRAELRATAKQAAKQAESSSTAVAEPPKGVS